jgi:hypothetical protein
VIARLSILGHDRARMNDPIDPVQAVLPERRWRFRRREDREGARPNEVEAEAEVVSAPEPPPETGLLAGFAAFAAQVLGQPGQKRGLKGGPETLEKARSAYLEAEYSGPADRRLTAGRITRTKV